MYTVTIKESIGWSQRERLERAVAFWEEETYNKATKGDKVLEI